ncbi:hypothetical protein ANAPC5_01298 [Anaplasma phagocytophilum]|nr:hypothetical protein ANAPC5_01298 [Anaplasma phagocytophilum]
MPLPIEFQCIPNVTRYWGVNGTPLYTLNMTFQWGLIFNAAQCWRVVETPSDIILSRVQCVYNVFTMLARP